jgi:hypothetical protein
VEDREPFVRLPIRFCQGFHRSVDRAVSSPSEVYVGSVELRLTGDNRHLCGWHVFGSSSQCAGRVVSCG